VEILTLQISVLWNATSGAPITS